MLEHRPEPVGDTPTQKAKLASLRVGDGYYALDIMSIREIIRPLPITSVPKAPPFIDGVISLRKMAIPVVDLRRRFGLPVAEADRAERMVICSVEGRMVALVVNEVTEVRSYDREAIQPAPYYLSGQQARFFPGVCRQNDRMLLLLDLKRILSSDLSIDGPQIEQQLLTGGE